MLAEDRQSGSTGESLIEPVPAKRVTCTIDTVSAVRKRFTIQQSTDSNSFGLHLFELQNHQKLSELHSRRKMAQQPRPERPIKEEKKEEQEERSLPVLPVRDTVLFPHAVLPLTVGTRLLCHLSP